ncbi:MAG TPA: HAMP domain-containing sensor histidine kinase [Bryobacteraceae bacterium]|jgi:signal transduction histidine kinase
MGQDGALQDAELESPGSEFLHALLHDLRGPLARVRILCELLRRRAGNQDPEVETLVGQVGASAAAAETALEGVRRYAEALDRPYRPTRFDLNAALDSAQAFLAASIAASGASIERGSLPSVWGDIVQLSALFQELISNSLRFPGVDRPVIRIASLDSDPAHWVVTVTDNGTGIPETAVHRIFRPFGKASPQSGAGMGLAICRRIAEVHGGGIGVAPRTEGAEIRLLLPR